MKKIKILFIFIFVLSFSISNATYVNSSSNNGYNAPIIDGTIKFRAELKDGKVYTSWTKYNKNEGFKYYKVIRSQKVSNPIYPDNGYIKYSRDINFTSYVDEKVPNGINYYRVCAITTEKNRYCSNVVKIINNSQSVIFKVGPKRVDCVGSFPQKCLIVNGKYFYDVIVGFAYEEGYNYKIEVKKELVCNPSVVNNCPQDTSIYKYTLVKIISKEKDALKVCTMEYAPVCGKKNGLKKTYSNKCMLEGSGAKFLYKGECKINIKPIVIGGNRDKHGCIGSAGYTWCEAKKKCIRSWMEKCEKKEEKIPKNCISWYDGCNTCGVKDGKIIYCTKRYCIRHDIPKCLKYKENIEVVKISEKFRKKIDYIIKKFILKIEKKYLNNKKRINILNSVIKKLNILAIKKPKTKMVVEYINKKFKEKISEYQENLNDIEKIFNEY